MTSLRGGILGASSPFVTCSCVRTSFAAEVPSEAALTVTETSSSARLDSVQGGSYGRGKAFVDNGRRVAF